MGLNKSLGGHRPLKLKGSPTMRNSLRMQARVRDGLSSAQNLRVTCARAYSSIVAFITLLEVGRIEKGLR